MCVFREGWLESKEYDVFKFFIFRGVSRTNAVGCEGTFCVVKFGKANEMIRR